MPRDLLAGLDNQPKDLLANQQPQRPGILSRALSELDRGAAATRAGLSAGLQGQNPATAFAGQLISSPGNAPTGTQVAQQAGFSAEPLQARVPTGEPIAIPGRQTGRFPSTELKPTLSPAQIAGLPIDILADPLNFVPGGALTKLFKASKPAKAIGRTFKAVKQKGLRGFAKVGKLSGIPEKDIINFVNRHKEVKNVVKEFGASGEGLVEAGKDFTQTAQKALRKQKDSFNKKVSTFFESAEAGNKKLKVQPIVDSLQKKMGRSEERRVGK